MVKMGIRRRDRRLRDTKGNQQNKVNDRTRRERERGRERHTERGGRH